MQKLHPWPDPPFGGPHTNARPGPLPSPFLPPLEVGPLKPSKGSTWGSAVSSPSEDWGKAPAVIDFGAF